MSKNLIVILIILIVIVLGVGIYISQKEKESLAPESEITLTIQLPKTSYETGEPIEGNYIIETPRRFKNLLYHSCEMVGLKPKCGGGEMRAAIITFKKYTTGPIYGCLITDTFRSCTEKSFKLPGNYILRLAIYDCDGVEKVIGKCDAEAVEKSGFEQIQPLKSVEKVITVTGEPIPYCQRPEDCAGRPCENCKSGHEICVSTDCVECLMDADCLEGYYCNRDTHKCEK